MCGVLKILMYRSKTREVKCSKCKRKSWIYSGICTQGRIHGIGWPRNAQHFMQWISHVRKWFAKRPCNKLGSVQFLLIERTHCMTDSGFPIAGVSRVSIIASVSRVASCIPVCPVNPGTGVPIVRNLKITDLGWFSHHSARCYCYLQHFHKVDHHGQMEIM